MTADAVFSEFTTRYTELLLWLGGIVVLLALLLGVRELILAARRRARRFS